MGIFDAQKLFDATVTRLVMSKGVGYHTRLLRTDWHWLMSSNREKFVVKVEGKGEKSGKGPSGEVLFAFDVKPLISRWTHVLAMKTAA